MDEIVYRVELWLNGRKTETWQFEEDDSDQAVAFWVKLTETVSTDTEVRLISPSC